MRLTIRNIRKNLSGLYSNEEVESFIFLIFNYLFGFTKTDLIIHLDFIVDEASNAKIANWIKRLQRSEPIQYILGETEFYGLNFHVRKGVLIPRQETELLVDFIVKRFQNHSPKILDIGSGSGCIPIALKKNLPLSEVWSCDISGEALAIANENALLNGVEVSFHEFDILSTDDFLTCDFDLIVSNPPYVTEREKELMENNVLDHEPHLALFVPDGNPLLFYNSIVSRAKRILKNRGEIFFEINEAYGNEVNSLLECNGFNASILKDLNGKDRIAHACLKR